MVDAAVHQAHPAARSALAECRVPVEQGVHSVPGLVDRLAPGLEPQGEADQTSQVAACLNRRAAALSRRVLFSLSLHEPVRAAPRSSPPVKGHLVTRRTGAGAS